MDFLQMQGTAKLQQVTQLLKSLEKDLQDKNLTSAERVQTLLKLRQHGTSPLNAEPIFSQNGISILTQYGVEGETPGVRRAALRCVANALLLDAKMRQILVDTGYGNKLADMLQTDDSEDEMIASRILFYTTYDTTMDFEKLVKSHGLADNVSYQLSRHAKQFPKSGKAPLSQMDELALTDTLKLIYNVSKIYTGLAASFSTSLPHILKIITRIDISHTPLDGILGGLLNALSILDLSATTGKVFENNPLFPSFDPKCNVDRLIGILDQAGVQYSPEDLEAKAVPLLYSLITIYEVAPEDIQKHMQQLLLPEEGDRSLPIGQSDTLPSRLLKLSTSHFANLKVAISELMFVLSGRDAEVLTKNIGYGFAAGFLAARGIEMPQSASETYSTDNAESLINPITGQKLAAEPTDDLPPMTQEEKEREAERLFVLFERARANGLLNVENPVTQALHEGRFEELPDDADSD
ncbi:Guanine nucleotide exchange factor Ric8 [Penicillium brevicompactum]|uniref:Guanine nucleotide exchange factor Ric8 n=1 Tax=Penicillium brevicompactum TaxID=5074 RepID=A0A9W9QII6_PENBR|nr:Guanine nucleotide exchange factor Ric8 [Penicillium brevicompactum]